MSLWSKEKSGWVNPCIHHSLEKKNELPYLKSKWFYTLSLSLYFLHHFIFFSFSSSFKLVFSSFFVSVYLNNALYFYNNWNSHLLLWDQIICLFALFQFYPVVCQDGKVHYSTGSFYFFCWLSLSLVIWPRLDDLFVSQNPREFCESHFLGQILGCAYILCLYGQI